MIQRSKDLAWLKQWCGHEVIIIITGVRRYGTGIIGSAWRLTDRHRLQPVISGNLPMLFDLYGLQFGQNDRTLFQSDIVVDPVGRIAFSMTLFGFELGEPGCLLAKEMLIGLVQCLSPCVSMYCRMTSIGAPPVVSKQ